MKGSVLLAISLLLGPALGKAQDSSAADSPARLADAQSFEAPLSSEVTHKEVADARRAMASAVAAEKFIDGVKTVLVVAVAIYLAWPDSGSSSSTVFMSQQTLAAPAGGV